MIKQPILAELKQFIFSLANFRGHPKNVTSMQLVRSSLNLLENLPAAREVVFEYFSLVFDISVGNFMSSTPKDGQTNISEEEYIQDIQEALEALIAKGPPAWGPLIANWSLELVGKLSNKYWPGKMDIGAACNLWLNCAAVKCLLGLIALSFRKMNNSEAEICVETLLGTFQKYSPTFDWVVARLGGCFPLKIISQVLQCGLKKYCEDFRCNFDSEIGILDYLSFAHEKDLKKSLKELLEDGLKPKTKLHVQIVPYLLQLATCSEVVLQVVVTEFLEIYNESYLEAITRQTWMLTIWMENPTFRDMQPSMNNLALKIKVNGSKLLMIVAKLAEKFIWCHDFIECALQELEHMVLVNMSCPLLEELSKEESKGLLWKSAKSPIFIEQQTAVRLILLVSTQYPHVYYQTISEMLTMSYEGNKNGIGPLIRLIGGLSGVIEYPTLRPGLEMVLERILLKIQFHSPEKQDESLSAIKNLYSLSVLEKSSSIPFLRNQPIQELLNDCILKVLKILESTLNRLMRQKCFEYSNPSPPKEQEIKRIKIEKIEKMEIEEEGEAIEDDDEEEEKKDNFSVMTHTLVKLLNSIEAGNKSHTMGMNETLKLSYLTVKYFFMSLNEKNSLIRSSGIKQALMLFQRQCSARKAARAACLRELIVGALYSYSHLFGGLQDFIEDEELKIDESEKLITLNRKHGHGTTANRSTLHAGLIGNGLKAENGEYIADNPNSEFQTCYLKALDACCVEQDKVTIDGYVQISLLLVEMVSSDVMYNGLPFPEEDFTKVTMERDLMIRRAFRAHPILWALLSLIAMHRPALCYSSVLLRGLCASCLHQWRAKNVNKFQQPIVNEELLKTTCQLLEVMAMGQLLPPPISNLHLIIKYLDAPEIALVLKECVWNYLKDHVPSPTLFQTDSNGLTWRDSNSDKPLPQYVDTLRNIMQKKLPKLGAFYHQMFALVELEKNKTDETSDSNVQL
ncbi:integrator complex subunit 5 [Condylostylus longicornis]|uniref:integrator complex subunit 5 n=1 Tax=Condylostylus longicornis TaxID=2530218 RepID=UPI00244E5477|nr:integrator complex subunit 5 [Condylostylus longicornis]